MYYPRSQRPYDSFDGCCHLILRKSKSTVPWEIGTHNTMKITMDNMSQDQSKEVEQLVWSIHDMCLELFSAIRYGTMI
jgi:hypothetical protein